MTTDRRTVSLAMPPGGWASPWPCAFELARVLPTIRWTLIGGAMVQLHALSHEIGIVRPTDDLDLLLHIEIDPDIARDAHRSITELGYELREPSDIRNRAAPHYRYVRRHAEGMQKIDVMVADHAAPRAAQRLQGRPMFAVDGGTQALKRTMIYKIESDESEVGFSVPDELGALVLKGAAHLVDNRDADRHLQDAAVLAACIHDHAAEIRRLHAVTAGGLRISRGNWPIWPTRPGSRSPRTTGSQARTRCEYLGGSALCEPRPRIGATTRCYAK